MFVDMRGIDYPLTAPIKARVEARLAAALSGVVESLHKVVVRLNDVNATRGGVDKRCRIVVALRGRSIAVAEATHSDLYAAIDEAARRIRRIVTRAARQQLMRSRRDANHHRVLVGP